LLAGALCSLLAGALCSLLAGALGFFALAD